MSEGRKIPNTRINKFFSQEDFNLEVEMGREAIEGDGNFTVILFRVDRQSTASDDVYGEAGKDEIKYFPPVELKVIPTIAGPENKTYSNGMLRHLEDGNLSFGIYDAQLAELDTDISYGDYIGYPIDDFTVRYFSVVNDGKKNYDNAHTIMGYQGAFRSVDCAPVDETEFRGI
jgi:hypothetical protein